MSVPSQIAFAVSTDGASLKVYSVGARVGDVLIQEAQGNYLRPGGVFTYFRPDGTSVYKRP